MKPHSALLIVLVTAPNPKVARQLATGALQRRLIACANLMPAVESHYWWQGKIEKSSEVLLLLKTTRPHARELERFILESHPYDTPEFVVLKTDSVTRKYLRWAQDAIG